MWYAILWINRRDNMKNIVNILDFGAVANSAELQTEKIQAAIDHCFSLGGGVVEIPGGVFLTGGIRIRSNINLHLHKDAVLKGSRNPEDYFGYKNDKIEPLDAALVTDAPWTRAEIGEDKDKGYEFYRTAGSRWNNGLIRAINAENIAITGEGVIDGSDCFDALGEENYRGPHLISLHYCKNVVFNGYTAKDSANWAHCVFHTQNILMENVTVLAGHDGIHMSDCCNIRIKDCKFYTGDDCVAGFPNINVTVTGCELNSACSAMRFGGTNVLVEKCHIYGPCKYLFRGSLSLEEKKNGIAPSVEGHRNNMLSVFTYYSDYSLSIPIQPGNIIIKDCIVDYADRFLHYNYSGNEWWQQNRPLASITFENIKATDISMPLTAYGAENTPIDVTLKNVDISLREGAEEIDFMHVCNYNKIKLDNVSINNYKGNAIIKKWSEGNIEINNLKCDVAEDKIEVTATEKFECQPI